MGAPCEVIHLCSPEQWSTGYSVNRVFSKPLPADSSEGKDGHKHNAEKPGEQLHLSMSTASFYPDDPRSGGSINHPHCSDKTSISERRYRPRPELGGQQRQKRTLGRPPTALHRRRV